MRKTRPLEERFWEKVTRGGPDECWDWQEKNRDAFGYGGFKVPAEAGGVRNQRAHVTAWVFTNGPVPKGLFVCHTCDRPPCCNPAHLWVGTPKDNALDMMRKGRSGYESHRGEANGLAKLTWPQVREIRRRYADGGITQTALADEYGITQSVVSKIVRRVMWLE